MRSITKAGFPRWMLKFLSRLSGVTFSITIDPIFLESKWQFYLKFLMLAEAYMSCIDAHF